MKLSDLQTCTGFMACSGSEHDINTIEGIVTFKTRPNVVVTKVIEAVQDFNIFFCNTDGEKPFWTPILLYLVV